MIINAQTKIASLINHNPEALEAIVSISPKFTKLRNKVLRKVIAGRTSIAMASKIGGCTVEDFFTKLQPLGFNADAKEVPGDHTEAKPRRPAFIDQIDPSKIIELDVRPVIETGKDPLNIILEKVNGLQPGHSLKIINSFEPTPLIHLLEKKGFQSYAGQVNEELVFTWFYRETGEPLDIDENKSTGGEGWDEIFNRFQANLVTIDVRGLEMPLPMHRILESLKDLPVGKALFVYHKRIPVFLLPELEEQKFTYRIKEISDGEVQLLIYKD